MYLSFDAVFPLPGIFPEQYEDICKRLFIASLFIIAKYWKQPQSSNRRVVEYTVTSTRCSDIGMYSCKRESRKLQ